MKAAFSVAAVALVVVGSRLAAQPQSPLFRTETNYVEVDTVVTDREGRYITDLSQAEFTVLEDRKAQDITTFSVINLPTRRDPWSLPPDVPAPAINPSAKAQGPSFDGRIYLLYLESYSIDESRTANVRRIGREFIEHHLGPQDVAAVWHATPWGRHQSFTADRGALLVSVNAFMGHGRDGADATPEERRRRALELGSVLEWFGHIQGRRKSVIYIRDSSPDLLDRRVRRGAGGLGDFRAVIDAAQRQNILIYALDPRGLITPYENIEPTPGAASNVGPGYSSHMAGIRGGVDSLISLSQSTGAFAFVNQNDFRKGLARIVEDNSHYYLLGYHSSNQTSDGKFRELDVRVSRPGVTVRARRGYVATGPQP